MHIHRANLIAFSLTSLIWGTSYSDVPNTFVAGQPALASEVNENFNDLDTRLTTLESAASSDIDYSDFSMPFSAVAAEKNVIVLKSVDENSGYTGFYLRIRYENNSETIQVAGSQIVRTYIAKYIQVVTDSAGDIVSIGSTIESPDTSNYNNWNVESATYSLNGQTKTVTKDTQRLEHHCSGSATRICIATETSSADGSYQRMNPRTQIRKLAKSFTLPATGWIFDEVIFRSEPSKSQEYRVFAKSIGEIHRSNNSSGNYYERNAIYYRVNGQTAGSLAGTPFASGEVLEDVFF